LKPWVLVAFAFVCMGIGWFCFQGPGRAIFSSKPDEVRLKTNEAAVLADASRPGRKDPPPDAVKPENKGDVKPADNSLPKAPRQAPDPVVPPPPPSVPAPMPKPTPPLSASPALTYEQHAAPIFQARCISCHGATRKRGGLDMRTVAAMLKGGENGPSLVPGKPEQSLLWESIATNRMPPGQNKLSQSERKAIQEWIAGGARTAQTANR